MALCEPQGIEIGDLVINVVGSQLLIKQISLQYFSQQKWQAFPFIH